MRHFTVFMWGVGHWHAPSTILFCSYLSHWWGASVVICLEQGADLHTAQLMPLPLTVSCFCKIQIGFTFLVLAHPASPRQRAVKWVCVTADQSFFFLMPDILYDARANTWQKDEMAECVLSLHRFLCQTEASIFHTTRSYLSNSYYKSDWQRHSCRPLWTDIHPPPVARWVKSALVVNPSLVDNPAIRQPGFDSPRLLWSQLNHFWTNQVLQVWCLSGIAHDRSMTGYFWPKNSLSSVAGQSFACVKHPLCCFW